VTGRHCGHDSVSRRAVGKVVLAARGRPMRHAVGGCAETRLR